MLRLVSVEMKAMKDMNAESFSTSGQGSEEGENDGDELELADYDEYEKARRIFTSTADAVTSQPEWGF